MSFRRSKAQLRKKKDDSSDEEPTKPAAPVVTKPTVQKGLQIGSIGIVKSDKKPFSKSLSFDDDDESASGFAKKISSKSKSDAKSTSTHTFGKGSSEKPVSSRGSYYTNTSYSSDEIAALAKNAKSLGAGSVIKVTSADKSGSRCVSCVTALEESRLSADSTMKGTRKD